MPNRSEVWPNRVPPCAPLSQVQSAQVLTARDRQMRKPARARRTVGEKTDVQNDARVCRCSKGATLHNKRRRYQEGKGWQKGVALEKAVEERGSTSTLIRSFEERERILSPGVIVVPRTDMDGSKRKYLPGGYLTIGRGTQTSRCFVHDNGGPCSTQSVCKSTSGVIIVSAVCNARYESLSSCWLDIRLRARSN